MFCNFKPYGLLLSLIYGGIVLSSQLAYSASIATTCPNKKLIKQSPETNITKYISNYIEANSIPKEVKKLVNKYQKCPTKKECYSRYSARQKAYKEKKVGGGRQRGWVAKMFGMKENSENIESDDFYKALKDVPAPMTWSIEEIDQAFEAAQKKLPPSNSKPNIYMEKGLGANYWSRDLGNNGIIQIASQFNYLEATSPNHIATVDSYIDDFTQGPQASLEAASAALHRRVAILSGKLKDALLEVLPPDSQTYYQNGYLELFRIKEPKALQKVATHIKKNIKKLGSVDN